MTVKGLGAAATVLLALGACGQDSGSEDRTKEADEAAAAAERTVRALLEAARAGDVAAARAVAVPDVARLMIGSYVPPEGTFKLVRCMDSASAGQLSFQLGEAPAGCLVYFGPRGGGEYTDRMLQVDRHGDGEWRVVGVEYAGGT